MCIRDRVVPGAVNLALGALVEGYRLLLPGDSAQEAALIEGVAAYGLSSLREVVEFLIGVREVPPAQPQSAYENPEDFLDLLDVKGQAKAKRALEIAAAGGHHLLMIGTPGSGKTMLAKRMPGLLPPLSREEALEVTRIHSAAGRLVGGGLIKTPPYRSPHSTISDAGLIGGGCHFQKLLRHFRNKCDRFFPGSSVEGAP